MTHKLFLVVLAGLFTGGVSLAQSKNSPSRGELLYSTHCIACHSTQLHWRDKKLATNWSLLKAEVDRWQKTTGLRWRDEDVAEVARYLNALYYHFPAPALGRTGAGSATAQAKSKD